MLKANAEEADKKAPLMSNFGVGRKDAPDKDSQKNMQKASTEKDIRSAMVRLNT